MKQHLLSFIGAIVPTLSLYFFDAPYINKVVKDSVTNEFRNAGPYYNISYLMGFGSDYNLTNSTDYLINSFALALSIILSLIMIVMIIRAIVGKKNVVGKCFMFSTVHVFTIYTLTMQIYRIIKYNTKMLSYSSSSIFYSVGWGLIVLIVLFSMSFILNLVNYIINATKNEVME